jgi:transcriptional regulator with XRE-family HTH domain
MLDPAELGRDHVGLSDALRMLRKASGLSGDRLAQRAHMSQSKVSKIETGKVLPTVMDVERIVTALDVPPAEAAKLLRSARAANTGFESRRLGRQRGAVRRQTDFAALMSQAAQVRYVLPTMLSGLLQTRTYVHSNVNHPLSALGQGERAKLVAAKLARQAVLDDPSKHFTFVLTEAAVRCRVAAPADMADQVEHLVALSRRSTVDGRRSTSRSSRSALTCRTRRSTSSRSTTSGW